MNETVFGLGIGAWALIGVIALILGVYGTKFGLPRNARGWMKAIGSVILIGAVLSYLGVFGMLAPQQAEDTENAIWEVSATESDPHVTYDSDQNKFVIQVDYDTSSESITDNTEYMEANFTISRADTMLDDAIAHSELRDVPEVQVDGDDNEPVLDQTSSDEYKCLFEKDGGHTDYESQNVLVEAGGSEWMTMNITVSDDAVDEMDQYDSYDVTVDIAGQPFTVEVLYASQTS